MRAAQAPTMPSVAEVFAAMNKRAPDWNAYGRSRESAVELAMAVIAESFASTGSTYHAPAPLTGPGHLEETGYIPAGSAAERERAPAPTPADVYWCSAANCPVHQSGEAFRAQAPAADERAPLPPIKGAWIDGGYVIVTPAGFGDTARPVRDAILRLFPNADQVHPAVPHVEPAAFSTADQRSLTASAWVPVSERLPEKFTEVLIAFAESSLPSTGQYTNSSHDHDGWCYPRENCDWLGGRHPTVTHWMPLPPAPGASPLPADQGDTQ